MQNVFEKFARRCSRLHKQTTFSDADFLGALRVKCFWIAKDAKFFHAGNDDSD